MEGGQLGSGFSDIDAYCAAQSSACWCVFPSLNRVSVVIIRPEAFQDFWGGGGFRGFIPFFYSILFYFFRFCKGAGGGVWRLIYFQLLLMG